MNEENFTILLSVYHKEKASFLHDCLASIVAQSLQATEVVCVIDGPIDDALERCLQEFRVLLPIKFVRLEKNEGLAEALNQGLQFCSNDLVVRVDTDDICFDDRFEKQISFMNLHPEISASSGQVEEWDENFSILLAKRTLPLDHSDLLTFAKFRSPLSHPATIFRKSKILHVGGYPELYPEDYFLWWKLILNGDKIMNLPDTLVKMRTGVSFYERRGLKFLRGELVLIQYLRRKGVLTAREFLLSATARIMLRTSPRVLKRLAYLKLNR